MIENRFRLHSLVILVVWVMFASGNGFGAELRAGVARVTIPVPVGCGLAGFPGSKRTASGTHDALQARVLILRTAVSSLALVSCDLHSFRSKRLAEEAKRRFKIDMLLLASSGSHSAPGLEGAWPGHEPWMAAVEDTILGAIEKANASTFAARLGSAAARVDLGYNWRVVDEYGSVSMLWRNPSHRATGPLSNSATVWRIDDDGGLMRAIVFHNGCRASVLGRKNLQVSADYPGFAASRIESELGGRVVSLFVQGASGNVVPYSNEQPVAEDAFGQAQLCGDILGRNVLQTARGISTHIETNPSLQVFRNRLSFKERWGGRRSVPLETATAVINRAWALATMPGAPFVEHQIALSDRSPVAGTLLLGHTMTENGEWAGILPTIRAAAEGGYGASGGDTKIEVGAGEAMVDAALVNIYRALDKLEDLPRGDLMRDMPPEGKKR